jgi:mycothiol synthase
MEGNVGSNWTPETCREKLTSDPRFDPENLFFATLDDRPVGSACAWTKSLDQRHIGEVHMVAVLGEHRGKGLGHLVNAAVLHRLKELGYRQAHLLTDDWRIPAVKSYLRAGFRPLHTHESHPDRWRELFELLGTEP